MTTRVVCLCCGREYDDVEPACPDWGRSRHSVELSLDVARYLSERGCTHPRPLDVKTAIAALDALSRGC